MIKRITTIQKESEILLKETQDFLDNSKTSNLELLKKFFRLRDSLKILLETLDSLKN